MSVTDGPTLNSISWRNRISKVWEKAAAVLTVIGLVDVTKQLIEWAELIHKVAQWYARARAWLFAWLPIHIPPEWHDYIVLSAILLSVINIGYYQRKHKLYVLALQNWVNDTRIIVKADRSTYTEDDWVNYLTYIVVEVCGTIGAIVIVMSFILLLVLPPLGMVDVLLFVGRAPLFVALSACVVMIIAGGGALAAWRWILVTAFLFGTLAVVNEVYLLLEPD